MKNLLEIDGVKAFIEFDPDIELFRGEFIGLNGSADFYAEDIAGLKKEGKVSLDVFYAMCSEKGIEPKKHYSGRFNVRIPSQLHEKIVMHAQSEHKSLNQWIEDTLKQNLQQETA
ncbi:type II toxin-antitoxin system HicB family antitoxin [Thiomicrospira microaerophila]|uniref:type II toxin-antitoxin system HicB family antitoxin n=1 Tax=Thiomicrospira microaerophila TaxID=406020 RepID=UPI0020104DB9|nr:type II toxin-antitoxin system HicB family antitoxin [Thiomicrospira microaerophila]UQB42879.1 type II toxin-antitoxin system HicB family antitoxin [Thiomicrospira microaerophila]